MVDGSIAVHKAVWIKRFLEDLEISKHASEPETVYCDIEAAMSFPNDARYHNKFKHIETKYNFIRDIVTKKEVVILYISTHSMITKPLRQL